MKKIFISLSPNPPHGFEYRTPARRDLLGSHVALFVDSFQIDLSLLNDFSERMYGVVITPGETFSHSAIGPELWRLNVPDNMFPSLRETASCFLDMMSYGQIALDENRSLKIELARSRKTQKQIQESYDENTKRLRKKVEELNKEIEERKRIEGAFRQSEENLRTTLNSIGDAVIATDLDGKIVGMNPVAEKLVGWTFEEAQDKPLPEVFNVINAQTGETAVNPVNNVLENREIVGLVNHTLLLAKDGAEYQIADSAAPIRGDEETITGVVLVFRDVTEAYRIQEALHESENKYRTLFEQSADAILIIEGDKFVDCNSATVKMLGYTNKRNLLETHPSQLSPDMQPDGRISFEKANEMMSIAFDQGSHRFEWNHKRRNGEVFPVEVLLTALPFSEGNFLHVVWRDITQRKQREEEHVRQERLAAVGQLAAGIGHDFNNVMAVITLYSELLQRSSNLSEMEQNKLLVIHQQAQHAAELTRQILDFSRRSVRTPRPLDLKALLDKMLKFVERTIPESIQVQFSFSRGDYMIHADPTQIQQVITNLTVNARDVMPHGGALYFNLSCLTLHVDDILPCHDMIPGEWIKLVVTDTGTGIDPNALPHIFEPFFTTKEVGKGTGLGLAQVYGIVQQHHGCIVVDSQVGEGTRFTIYLPALVRKTAVASEPLTDIPLGKGETILLVEDDQILLEAIHALLELLNYQVLAAVDGKDALEVYRTHTNQINLILSDVVMPKMDGIELVENLQGYSPPPKVLLMSGFPRDKEMRPEIKQFISGWLQKPLDLQQLAQTLQELLHP